MRSANVPVMALFRFRLVFASLAAVAAVLVSASAAEPQDKKDPEDRGQKSRYEVEVSAAAISPDGKFALLAYERAVAVSSIAFKIWDIDEAKVVIGKQR